MSALSETVPASAELARRDMLASADQLLDQVEQLRLSEQPRVPPTLREAIHSLQHRLGRPEPARPRTVRAAQQLVFAVQQRLMAANPRNAEPRAHVGRARGTPRVTPLARGGKWKELTFPPRPPQGPQGEWWAQVQLMVERAFDRWSFAQNQAVAAARNGQPAQTAVSRALAAWANYWELRCEAERLLRAPTASMERSSSALTGSEEAEIRLAKPSKKAARAAPSSWSASAMTPAASSASPGASVCSSWEAKSSGSL
ncbi:MAG TPA: hypothetical protein VIK45_13950 [Candidatus Dormibacteraeota bacterium]|jgi:hypothetical protein